MRKVLKDSKTLLFENMAKLNPDFKMKTVLNESPVDEISTGAAANAYGVTAKNKWNSDNPQITQRKATNQMERFRTYINPELKKYVEAKFSDVQGFKMYKGNENETILEIPIVDGGVYGGIHGQETAISVEIHILPEEYHVMKNVNIKMGNRERKEKIDGGTALLSEKHISILPTIIKRIQADMRREKSQFNPAKPEPTPEPVQQEPIPEPVQQEPIPEPVKKTGFLNKIKNRFKEGVGEELGEAQFKLETYFETLSAALEAAVQMAESRGFTVDNDELFNRFGTGVGYGETKSGYITIYKEGKEQRKGLQITIYRMPSGRYELTTYIN